MSHINDNANTEISEDKAEAKRLRKEQDRIKSKYAFLKNVSQREFQSEYVRVQAEEICRYIAEIQLTPLNPWYSKLMEMASDGKFMSQFYLTFNEFDTIEPDYERIKTLILPEPKKEDFPKLSCIPGLE